MDSLHAESSLGSPPSAPTARRSYIRHDAEDLKQAILAAATTEFLAKGYAGARINLIVKRSGANKRMLYSFFGSKLALYRQVLAIAIEHLHADEARIAVAGEPAAALSRHVGDLFACYARHASLLVRLVTDAQEHVPASFQNSPAIARLTKTLDDGRRTGAFNHAADPQLICSTIRALAATATTRVSLRAHATLFAEMLLDHVRT